MVPDYIPCQQEFYVTRTHRKVGPGMDGLDTAGGGPPKALAGLLSLLFPGVALGLEAWGPSQHLNLRANKQTRTRTGTGPG